MQIPLPLNWGPNKIAPTFDEAATELGDIPGLVFRAIDFGAVKNRQYFDELSDGERPTSHIREAIVRHQAKRFLKRYDIAVEEDKLALCNEPLVALVFRYRGIHIRVLKGRNGYIPGCGRSKPRKRFYGQLPTVYQENNGQPKRTKWNLLMLWDFDSAFNAGRLWLVCPIVGGVKASDVRWLWKEEIPHPVMTSKPAPLSPPDGSDDLRSLFDDEKLEDGQFGETGKL